MVSIRVEYGTLRCKITLLSDWPSITRFSYIATDTSSACIWYVMIKFIIFKWFVSWVYETHLAPRVSVHAVTCQIGRRDKGERLSLGTLDERCWWFVVWCRLSILLLCRDEFRKGLLGILDSVGCLYKADMVVAVLLVLWTVVHRQKEIFFPTLII